MATSIWAATGVTPAATNRVPVDVSAGGAASRVTVQQLADLGTLVGTSHNALGSINTNTAISLASGPYVSATITGALTFTFTNPPASPNGCEWTLILTNGGSAVVTWPGSVTWAGATAPTLTASGVDVLHFATGNGGTNWYGWVERDEAITGLVNFTQAESTSAPNATVYVDSLTANGASTNVDAALVPKGTGAVLAAVPNSAASGGNKRGDYAVDLQTYRTQASRVASGSRSVISGGDENTASGGRDTVAGGYLNRATGGYSNVSGGADNQATGVTSTVSGGSSNIASGTRSNVSGGQSNTASGERSWVPGGGAATTRGLYGGYAYSASGRSVVGDAQVIGQPVRRTTTATSATDLTADGGAVSATNVMVLPNTSGAHFVARVMAYRSGGGVGSWRVEGTIERGANAASTALVGTTTITAFGISASIGAPTVDVVANTTQGAPVVQVTPANTDATYWVSELTLIQGA